MEADYSWLSAYCLCQFAVHMQNALLNHSARQTLTSSREFHQSSGEGLTLETLALKSPNDRTLTTMNR